MEAAATRLRLVHPFPSALNAAATVALALVAGGSVPTAGRLGLAMFAIQASIGALNDLVDAPRDGGHRPPKPIPTGLVSRRSAAWVAALGAVAGVALAAASSPGAGLVAVAGLACGWAYDVQLSRTAWSWLPLAVALPLVPVYAWVGAVGAAPDGVLRLVPIGVLAGAGLAVANALADRDLDAAAGTRSVAVRLVAARAWWLQAGLLAGAVALAFVTLPPEAHPATLAACLGGAAGIAIGAVLLARPAPQHRPVRLTGWALQAVGVAIMGLGWLAAIGLGHAA